MHGEHPGVSRKCSVLGGLDWEGSIGSVRMGSTRYSDHFATATYVVLLLTVPLQRLEDTQRVSVI